MTQALGYAFDTLPALSIEDQRRLRERGLPAFNAINIAEYEEMKREKENARRCKPIRPEELEDY